MALLVRGPGRVEPSGHSTIDEAVAIIESFIDLGIIGPALLASFRIECDHTIERRGEIESAIDENGSGDRKSTRLNSSHLVISYAVFCLKKKKKKRIRAAT